jgi:two-component system repressor protein LuxO
VRELANCVRRAVVLSDGPMVTADALIMTMASDGKPAAPVASPAPESAVTPYWQQERAIIERAVTASGGNIARAAAALGISPATVYRKRNIWRTGGTG